MVQPSKSEWIRVLGWFVWVMAAVAMAGAQETASHPTVLVPERRVVVSIPDRKLAVVENGVVLRTFAVAVGATSSPTPTGTFAIVNRLAEPTYYHAGVVIPPGSHNPLGPRWIGLNKKGYGIHGTSVPGSVGRAASHGCIRLRNRDIVEFAKLVKVGDRVEIRGERDAETAGIFGSADAPVAVAEVRDNDSGSSDGQ